MIDCQEVKQLLPLWVGQDLPDVASAIEVAHHLEKCPCCERQKISLQSSLEVLQSSSSKTFPIEPRRPSVWPQLSHRIAEWEGRRGRDRFEGWLPAGVMVLAVALMVAVSIPSVIEEIFGQGSSPQIADHFQSADSLEELRKIGELESHGDGLRHRVKGKIPKKRVPPEQW
jgi:hypothetical protein